LIKNFTSLFVPGKLKQRFFSSSTSSLKFEKTLFSLSSSFKIEKKIKGGRN
jgi:hypothetical protein